MLVRRNLLRQAPHSARSIATPTVTLRPQPQLLQRRRTFCTNTTAPYPKLSQSSATTAAITKGLENNSPQQNILLQRQRDALNFFKQSPVVRSKEEITSTNDYLLMSLLAKVYDVCVETPLVKAEGLSKISGNNVYLKREDLQPSFSFKVRGAYNKLAHLTEEERSKGVICCSAGNHAQGVAMAAERMKVDAVIVMPVCAPPIKVEATKRYIYMLICI